MVTELYEYTKNHWIIYCELVNCIVCELQKKKKKQTNKPYTWGKKATDSKLEIPLIQTLK